MDSLNEELPIKMTREKSLKMLCFHGNDSSFNPHGMGGRGRRDWERCQTAQKQFIIKTY